MEKNKETLHVLRHSCSHIMAQAVQKLFPQAKLAIGPATDAGFYYDFDLTDGYAFTQDDLAKIEEEMKNIIKQNLTFEKYIIPDVDKQIAEFKAEGEIYKAELLEEHRNDNPTLYFTKDKDGNVLFNDLCAGPHIPNTSYIKGNAIKLLKVAGAYWRGNEKNKMLQRIYATAYWNKEDLQDYLTFIEEAEKRDHRKLGTQLDLFSTREELGGGLVLWHPNLATVREQIENYWREEHRKRGYVIVNTPQIAKSKLWEISGHMDHYKENMFPPMEMEGESFVLRPMNCPHHMMIYANKMHSYKDLPIRIGEIAHDFRFEASGTLKGIERGRHFCQNDAHLFVTPEQIESEFKQVVDLIFDTYKDFNITDYRCVLSLRDPEDKVKYHDDDEMWNTAEDALRKVLDDIGIEYTEEIGEAAFYGPKLDVNVKPAIGNEYTLSTCQLDFCLPAKFNLTYIDKDGTKKTPVVLHRAILGSLDRFMAYILEETKGNLPLWLAPVQARILPVKNEDEELNAYAHELYDFLDDNNIRVEIDERAEKLGYRVRAAQVEKVPYLIILGKNEVNDKTVSYRLHGEQKTTTVPMDEFLAMLQDEIKTKKLNPAASK